MENGLFLSASVDENVKVWDSSSWTEKRTFSHNLAVLSMSVGNRNQHVASSSMDGTIAIFDPTKDLVEPLKLDVGVLNVWKACMHPTEPIVATGSHTGSLNQLRFTKFDGSTNVSVSEEQMGSSIAVPGDSFILSVAYSSSGLAIASGDATGGVNIFDSLKEVALGKIRGHQKPIRAVAFYKDGDSKILSGSQDQSVRLFDMKSGEEFVSQWSGHAGWVTSLKIHPIENNLFATSSTDGRVRIFDIRLEEPIVRFKVHSDGSRKPIWDLAFSPDGKQIAVADDLGDLSVFELNL